MCAKIGSDRVAIRLSPNGVFNQCGPEDFREQFTYAFQECDKVCVSSLTLGLRNNLHLLSGKMAYSLPIPLLHPHSSALLTLVCWMDLDLASVRRESR